MTHESITEDGSDPSAHADFTRYNNTTGSPSAKSADVMSRETKPYHGRIESQESGVTGMVTEQLPRMFPKAHAWRDLWKTAA